MKSAIRMPIAMPLASGLRPGGTATSRVSHSSSFMVSSRDTLLCNHAKVISQRLTLDMTKRQAAPRGLRLGSVPDEFYEQ